LLWVIPWLFINKAKPEKHPWITEEEQKLILADKIAFSETDDTEKEKGLSVAKILSYKESWGVLMSRFFIEPIWWLFVGWMPLYLNSK
ncbi:MFS transporter, partial [Zobellia amurskyensis]|nr:MFS transporter [Zobellia amurskyensis]